MSQQQGTTLGTMIVVVGPSGAGKDSLIDFAKGRLAGHGEIGFVKRFITRDADAGSEDHHAVTLGEFEHMRDAGRFAVHWGAHDLHYGIPVETREALARGRTLIANGSRAALPEFIAAYPSIIVVTITADPAIIAERLKNRGRESEESISRRLARSPREVSIDCRQVTIDNSGALDVAGTAFVDTVLRVAENASQVV